MVGTSRYLKIKESIDVYADRQQRHSHPFSIPEHGSKQSNSNARSEAPKSHAREKREKK